MFGFFKNVKKEEPKIEARNSGSSIVARPMFSISFDGEKNIGELGPLINYKLEYNALRSRSWESYLTSEITQTVINKFITWVIGSGLKLQSEPVTSILQSKGITLSADYTKKIEDLFSLYCSSVESDYHQKVSLHKIAKEGYKNAIIGGDVLVIQRVENGNLNTQLVDGCHIQSPPDKRFSDNVKNGIETDSKGRIVAFYVKNKKGEYDRILAKGTRSKMEMAFLITGFEYRIDDNRGIPLICAVLETLKKIDRYKEATVGSAEERAKIAYTIEHGVQSTGENPMINDMAKAFNVDSNQDIPIDINGQQLADKVAATTNKQVFNMPIDSTLKSLESKQELNFPDFYGVNANSICSTVGIPPEVAFSKYDSNFSASRAALKDWEHTLNVNRKDFSFQFYAKIFSNWLDLAVLKNEIQIPGYINAMVSNDKLALQAFKRARFVGANVPHIDPLKEVKAEREKLGELGKNMPLTTAEMATEALNGGDYNTNATQFSKEYNDFKVDERSEGDE